MLLDGSLLPVVERLEAENERLCAALDQWEVDNPATARAAAPWYDARYSGRLQPRIKSALRLDAAGFFQSSWAISKQTTFKPGFHHRRM